MWKISAAVLLAAACASPVVTPGPIELVGPPGSGEPNLFATADGRVVLTWLEPLGDDHHALRVAERRSGAWSEPRTVVTSESLFVNWADFPSLLETSDGVWIAHWLQRVSGARYAYHVMAARSLDRGQSWSPPFRLHDDASPTEHGFVSMAPLASGATAALWLDGQATTPMADASPENEHDAARGAMTVRFRVMGPDGSLEPERLLDGRACDCCQTALALTTSGLVAAYRDRSEAEVRDVVVARYVGGRWSEPVAPAAQGWHIEGCPVNGPSVDALGDTVVVAWFTAANDAPRVSAAFSVDGGASFSDPIPIDDGHPVGRVDVEFVDEARAVVIWLERGTEATEVRGRVVAINGERAESWVVARSSEARAAGFPRVARAGDELVFAWTETGSAGGIRAATARLR